MRSSARFLKKIVKALWRDYVQLGHIIWACLIAWWVRARPAPGCGTWIVLPFQASRVIWR